MMPRLFVAVSVLLTFFFHASGCASSANTAARSSFLDFLQAIAIIQEVSIAAHQYREATGNWPSRPHQLATFAQTDGMLEDTTIFKWLQFEKTPDSNLVVHITTDSSFVPGGSPLSGFAKMSGQATAGTSIVDIHLNFEDGGFLQGKMHYAGNEPVKMTVEAANIYLDENENLEPVSLTEEDLEQLERQFGIKVKE